MKTLLTIFTLVFTLMFSSTSFAEWTKVGESELGNIMYVDFERIRNQDGFVYFWSLTDLLEPNAMGDFSSSRYARGDCKLFRMKILSYVFHQQPMGRDVGDTQNRSNREWIYPRPDTLNERALTRGCRVAE